MLMSDCDVRLDSQFDLKYKCDLFLASFALFMEVYSRSRPIEKKYICTSLGTTVPQLSIN